MSYTGKAKPQLCNNQIRAINNHVIIIIFSVYVFLIFLKDKFQPSLDYSVLNEVNFENNYK